MGRLGFVPTNFCKKHDTKFFFKKCELEKFCPFLITLVGLRSLVPTKFKTIPSGLVSSAAAVRQTRNSNVESIRDSLLSSRAAGRDSPHTMNNDQWTILPHSSAALVPQCSQIIMKSNFYYDFCRISHFFMNSQVFLVFKCFKGFTRIFNFLTVVQEIVLLLSSDVLKYLNFMLQFIFV